MSDMPRGWEMRDGVLRFGSCIIRVSAIQDVCVWVTVYGPTREVVDTTVRITLSGGDVHSIPVDNDGMATRVEDAIVCAMREEAGR